MTLDELKPIGDRLIVRPDLKLTESAGGLAIPETVLSDNPNYYSMTGVVVKVGDGVREDVYRCSMPKCAFETGKTIGERCPACGAVQVFIESGERHDFDVAVGDRVLFGRFAGKQIEVEPMFGQDFEDFIMERPNTHTKVLVMRESEILAVVSGDERVLPGYQAASWKKPSKGLTPIVRSND